MSVFGSLFTAVSGLSAQAQSIGMISNNIANVSTIGYKRTDAAFSSLVTSESRSVLYSPGSVRAVQNARIDQQGILQQSNSSTDVAISGNGFFVVKRSSTDSQSEPLYTRAGSFSEDANGILQNTSGFYLYGWPLDQDGGLPASQADIGSLVPVDVAFLGGLTQPTSSAALAVNLNAGESLDSYPVLTGFTPDFTRGLRVYDSLGEGHDLTINFVKHESPTAIATGAGDNLSLVTGPIDTQIVNGYTFAAGDSFDLTIPSASPALTTITVGATDSMADVLAQIIAITDANSDPVAFATLDSNGFMVIKARNLSENISLANNSGTPLAGFGLVAGAPAATAPAAPTLLAAPDEVPNSEGWWHVEFKTPQGAIVNAGSINFTGSGQLNAAEDTSGDVLVALSNIDWGNGADLQDINFDLANFSQFSGEYNVISTTQNGAELGLRTGVSIDRDGFVTAQFSNGQSAKIYKLAVATFANANGLAELTGNVFRQSDGSGDFNLREAGLGSAGGIESGALEAANVDLADEFAKMIVTQRAYSANTKVISTADEMTSELLRLR